MRTMLLKQKVNAMTQKQPLRQFSNLFFFSRSNLFIISQECPFVPRTDMNFPGGSIMFFEQIQIFQEGLSKRHVFSRRFYLFVEQTLLSHRTGTNFPRKPLFSPRTHTNFPGASIFSSNRYSFSRKPYLVLEHLRFFRRPYLSPQTHTNFQEGTLSRTDISLIVLGGCF